ATVREDDDVEGETPAGRVDHQELQQGRDVEQAGDGGVGEADRAPARTGQVVRHLLPAIPRAWIVISVEPPYFLPAAGRSSQTVASPRSSTFSMRRRTSNCGPFFNSARSRLIASGPISSSSLLAASRLANPSSSRSRISAVTRAVSPGSISR